MTQTSRLFAPLLLLAAFGCQSPAASPALPPPPPWSAPADATARIRAAGLEPLPSEGTAYHIHAHLDVYYQGQAVEVPANIGIDVANGTISALHTHRDLGVLHVEAPTQQAFTLGQFFTEWNVPLTGARAYVNGEPVADPAAIVLADHQQIAVVYGTPPATIPAAYQGLWN